MDEEARQELLRLQESRECGRGARLHPGLRGGASVGARFAECRRVGGRDEDRTTAVRGQRLPFGPDARAVRAEGRDAVQGPTQRAADGAAEGGTGFVRRCVHG